MATRQKIVKRRVVFYNAYMTQSQHILVIEDDKQLVPVIVDVLKLERYRVTVANTGQEALNALEQALPDLVLSDMHLPDIHGLELLRRIQGHYPQLPYIFLSGEDHETDVVLGLELGAADYIVKPFRPRELLARLRKHLLKKPVLNLEPSKAFSAPFELKNDSRELKVRGQVVDLTTKEFDLLCYFDTHPQQVLTREQILNRIWPDAYDVSDRIVDTHVSHLRKKLVQAEPRLAKCFKTVRGVGYQWRPPEF